MSSCSTRSLLNTGTYQYIPGMYYIPVHTVLVCTIYQYIPVRTSTYAYAYVLVYTFVYWYILIQNGFRWTAEELQKVFDMLHKPEFDSEQVDPDLHKRMNKAIEDGGIKCFNMLESNLDVYQDLNYGTREMEDNLCEIMEDPIKGNHGPAGSTCQCT